MREVVELISRYVPIYATVARGHSDEEIARLEDVLGRPVPSVHRDFLTSMAANVGFPTGDIRFDIDPVIQLAQERQPIPEKLEPIAADDGTSYADFFLNFSHPHGKDDALVVRIPAGAAIHDAHEPIFHSLRDFLFRWAFTDIRLAAFPEKTLLLWSVGEPDTKGTPTVADLSTLMVRLGFEILDGPSAAARLFERGDASASLYQVPYRHAFSLDLAARDRATLISVAEVLRDALPAPT
jgi:hypothetical protein